MSKVPHPPPQPIVQCERKRGVNTAEMGVSSPSLKRRYDENFGWAKGQTMQTLSLCRPRALILAEHGSATEAVVRAHTVRVVNAGLELSEILLLVQWLMPSIDHHIEGIISQRLAGSHVAATSFLENRTGDYKVSGPRMSS